MAADDKLDDALDAAIRRAEASGTWTHEELERAKERARRKLAPIARAIWDETDGSAPSD